MKTFLLVLSVSIASAAFSQDSLIIKHNNLILLRSVVSEDTLKNKIKIDEDGLADGNIFIQYKTKEEGNWERTFYLIDDKDRILLQKKGTSISLDNVTLKQLFKKLDEIKVYTMALPTDPKLKASVRVRRILLCTLKLK
jgi:hypothetical protein